MNFKLDRFKMMCKQTLCVVLIVVLNLDFQTMTQCFAFASSVKIKKV